MIDIDPEKCSGCARCEVNCSFFHSGKVGRSGARIKVVRIEDIGIDFPVVCRHCKERFCVKCPESAILIGDLGQIVVSPTLCELCGVCETLCPIGAIEIYDEIPHVCDLCGGTPRCVEECVMGAIRFLPELSGTVSLKKFQKENRKQDPEEKRTRFAIASTEKLRRKWLADRRK